MARISAQAAAFRQSGFQCVRGQELLLQSEAVQERFLAALAEPFAVGVMNCHGGWAPEAFTLCLALAGQDRVNPAHLLRQTWPDHPLFHFDCCYVGATLDRGGGRLESLPAAALEAGASCVLSSVHPVFDLYAAELSAAFYRRLLGEGGLSVGEALLAARQELAGKHAGNPLVWAMLTVWGNAWVSLTE